MEQEPVGAAEVTTGEALALTAAGGFLLDVREQYEWDAGHAPQAKLVPMSVIESRVGELPVGERILVVCHSGQRSARVTEALRRAGFDAANVAGGMLAWRDAGGEVVSDGPGAPRV